jgi:hypothetical protein
MVGRPEINIKPWDALQEDLKDGNNRVKWMDREPYAYWKGNPSVSASRQELVKCNVSSTKDWNARIYAQVTLSIPAILRENIVVPFPFRRINWLIPNQILLILASVNFALGVNTLDIYYLTLFLMFGCRTGSKRASQGIRTQIWLVNVHTGSSFCFVLV